MYLFFDSAPSYKVMRHCDSKEAIKMVDLHTQWVACCFCQTLELAVVHL